MESEKAPGTKPTKPTPEKTKLVSKELLRQWLNDPELEHVVLVGLPKGGKGWVYACSNTEYEFLAAAEGIVQKLKINALNFTKDK